MNTATVQSLPVAQSLATAARVLGIAWLADLLFWKTSPGISIGLFALAIGAALLSIARRTRAAWILGALLAACSVQSAIELSFTNVACLGTLLLALVGEAFYASRPGGWARWSEAAFAVVTGPGRWRNAAATLMDSSITAVGVTHIRSGMLTQAIRIAFPAIAVTSIFLVLLGTGNDVLREAGTRVSEYLVDCLRSLSIGRTFLWVVWLTLGIAIFVAAAVPSHTRWWARTPGRWWRSEPVMARWQSILLLVAVNAVFFTANTADALYLWSNTALPTGVNASRFVHEGVYSLIAAVVLAALVLTAVFQQDENVSDSRFLKGLALAWVAQNAILIASVLLRLKLYVDAYQWTELRVYVGCFLALVMTGFALLSLHIVRGMKLGRLVFGNACATFALFFILQWCDVGTWVALRNVERWETDRRRTLDLEYIVHLGERGWPAIERLAASTKRTDLGGWAAAKLAILARDQEQRIHFLHWQEFQARRDNRAIALVEKYHPEKQ